MTHLYQLVSQEMQTLPDSLLEEEILEIRCKNNLFIYNDLKYYLDI